MPFFRCLHEWPCFLKLADLKGFVTKHILFPLSILQSSIRPPVPKSWLPKIAHMSIETAQGSFDFPLLLSSYQAVQKEEMKFSLISAAHRHRKIF